MLAMALTGKITPYKNLFGPFPGEIYHTPFPIGFHGVSVEDSLNALDSLFKVDIALSDVAAIIVEPTQGKGDFYPAPVEFLHALRKLCDEHGIVLLPMKSRRASGGPGNGLPMNIMASRRT
jgi:4-aminobutyrate aminotransferase/(S)-3-amino-2-methylpropionate transaminase